MENIDRLTQSVERLLEENRTLKAANTRLTTSVVAAEAVAESANRKAAELEAQLTQLLLRSSIKEVAGGVKAARLRVSRLIREIDKCIAMVNK